MMKALVLHRPGELRLEHVPKPAAAPGSVVVRVLASPVWGYVSGVIDGSLKFPHTYPQVFGTCCVGRVDEVGPDVTTLSSGQLVFCDHIVYLRDAPEHRIVLGYHGGHSPLERALSSSDHWRDGCWAEYARIPAENAHVVDEPRLAATLSAPLSPLSSPNPTPSPATTHAMAAQLCEIASVMSAVGAANAAGLHPGATVIVAPATGFFSSSAVAATLGLGAARVVVAGRREETLRAVADHFDFRRRGGEEQQLQEGGGGRIAVVALTGDDVEGDVAALRAATPRGEGADVFLDFASPESGPGYVLAGLRALKRGGCCCLAGALPADLPLPYLHVRINSLTVRGSFAQRREDVEATIRMVEAGIIKLRKAVVGEFALEDVQRALQLARQSDGWDKMVVLKP